MIHEQISVQMGHLVLHHTAGKLIESLGNLLEITIVIFNGHALWPCDIAVDSGDAETPFGIFTFLLALLKDDRVDHHPFEIGEVRIDIGHPGAVNYKDPDALADPEGRQVRNLLI